MVIPQNEFIGQPILNLQRFLREISNEYGQIQMVLPDGVYGSNTRRSVEDFQGIYGIEVTGQTDFDTWNKIVEVYTEIIDRNAEPRLFLGFYTNGDVINEADESEYIFIIQAILHMLSLVFDNIPSPGFSGVNDEATVNSVKSVQRIFGKEETGKIDKDTWDDITALHESHYARSKEKTGKVRE